MGKDTGISWTDATWNPIRGCSVVSAGCKNCYAMEMAARFAGPGQPYEGLAYKDRAGHAHWTGEVMFVERHLYDPLHWRTPQKIFVNSMSDLYHPNVSWEDTCRIFAVMAVTPQHTYQVLTKRPERQRTFMEDISGLGRERIAGQVNAILAANPKYRIPQWDGVWPLPNLWAGTSVENQTVAEERIPHLVDTPAAVHFLSCEPLLGPLDLRMWLGLCVGCQTCLDWEDPELPFDDPRQRIIQDWHRIGLSRIEWVIVGGESGRYFRVMDWDWARNIRNQCLHSETALWFKQGSQLRPGENTELDGRTYHQFPTVRRVDPDSTIVVVA